MSSRRYNLLRLFCLVSGSWLWPMLAETQTLHNFS
jgi:hypothetical protein